jgi:hypothetical protein
MAGLVKISMGLPQLSHLLNGSLSYSFNLGQPTRESNQVGSRALVHAAQPA